MRGKIAYVRGWWQNLPLARAGLRRSLAACALTNYKMAWRATRPIDDPVPAAGPAMRRVKTWLFRAVALLVMPALFFGVAELILRLTGFGYPTGFLLPETRSGEKVFVQNNRFGWRFFGPELARVPFPFCIPQAKSSNTVRIFIFGESAAYGDPDPLFGLARMLEAVLGLRHPGTRFEVVNAAMTGINSHAILSIARDCARAQADVWIIYMGNNEVVGPFGAGTVFGLQAPPLPLIRASIALKATRVGQLLDSIRRNLLRPRAAPSEWGGMTMFLEQRVRADDPRMGVVYRHFGRNLLDIIRAARRHGTKVVVSTVAVNLRDCPPFASAHRPDLAEQHRAEWARLYRAGVEAQAKGDNVGAAEYFGQAAQIDDTVAELRFRQGLCALESGAVSEAQRHFNAARDFDTLRFRCDSRLNELIRQAVSELSDAGMRLIDAERVFAEQSPAGSPGHELFYDHVHLTFEGNYLLARALASVVEGLVPQLALQMGETRSWPTVQECAVRLGWTDWAKQRVLSDMLVRLTDPPFTWQLDHADQLARLKRQLEELLPAPGQSGYHTARERLITALDKVPDDPWLHVQMAELGRLAGDLETASRFAQRAVELAPTSVSAWFNLGLVRAQQRRFDETVQAFSRAVELDPLDVWAMHNLAEALVKLGQSDAAARVFRRAVKLKPHFGVAWLGLGAVLEQMGRTAEAQRCYEMALANRVRRATELTILARFCKARGWLEPAATNYAYAITLSPADPQLRIEYGQCLQALGRSADAAAQFAEAARLAPGLLQARFLYGLALARRGEPAKAEVEFREAVRLMPELIEARLNLALTLLDQGRLEEALAEFEAVLARSPTNELALRWCETIRAKLGESQPK